MCIASVHNFCGSCSFQVLVHVLWCTCMARACRKHKFQNHKRWGCYVQFRLCTSLPLTSNTHCCGCNASGYTWAAKALPFLRHLMLGAAAKNLLPMRQHYTRVIAALEALPPLQRGAQGNGQGGVGTQLSPSQLATAFKLPHQGGHT